MLNKFYAILTAFTLTFFAAIPQAHATVFGSAAPTLTIGGRVFTDLTNLKILQGAAAVGKYFTFRDVITGAAYQVPASKTFKVLALKMVSTAAQATAADLCYGDSDVGQNSVSAPTNITYQIGYNGIDGVQGIAPFVIETNFSIPTGKYPCLAAVAGTGVAYVYGYEQ